MSNSRIVLFLSVLFCLLSAVTFASEIEGFGLSNKQISLKQAIKTGLKQNRQLQKILDSLELSELDLETARAEFRTRFSTSVSSDARLGTELGQTYNVSARKKFQYGTNLTVSGNSSTFGDSTLSEISAQISQPLMKGRGKLANTMSLVEAEWNNEKRLLLKEMAETELIYNIIVAYHQAIRQQKNIEVHDKNLERVRKLVAAAQAKLKVGMVSKMDVLRAEIQASQAEDSLKDAENNLDQAADTLRQLLGMGFDEAIGIIPQLECETRNLDLDLLREKALATRRDKKILERDVELSRRRLKIAEESQSPPVDLTLQVSQIGQGVGFSDSMELDETRVGIGLAASTDFFTSLGKTGYRKAWLAYKGKKNELEQKKVVIINEVRDAYRRVSRGSDRISLREKRIADAGKQVEYAMRRYEKGLIDNLAVIDAEKELVEAKTDHISAVIDYIIAIGQLDKATDQLRDKWLNTEQGD
ncbi:MAG: TolC family protein [Candidatus Marinimicrobia bacterium]|nr:TolC family protein [Candidatus Neomarinimicrobiota bacterium]